MQRYKLCGPHIVSKVLDGEAIIINLDSGAYYSLDGVGATVWEALSAGHSLPDVVQSIREHYDCNGQAIDSDVDALLRQLLDEKLFEADASASASAAAASPAPSSRPPYVRPQLNVYSDMADLLALDPPVPGFLDAVPVTPAS